MAVRLPRRNLVRHTWKDGGVTVEAMRSGIDLTYVDSDARPQDDLFGHVNGRWLADYEMPADRATDGAFRLLYDRAEEQVRDLITEPPRRRRTGATARPGTDEQRIGDLYASFMDDRRRRAARRRTAARRARRHRRAPTTPTRSPPCSARLQRTGVGGGARHLRRHRLQELRRATCVHLTQSGLGLPDESYYRDDAARRDPAPPTPQHIAAMFALVYGGPADDAADGRRADRRAGDQDRRRRTGTS